jgi:hypothetical protein
MTNSTPTPDAAAAKLAALDVLDVAKAQRLDDNEPFFARVAERMTEHLDATGLFDDVAYAELHDACYSALEARVAELLA